MEINKTELVLIIAFVIVLTIVAICFFPESTDPLLDLIKSFLSLFIVTLSGALSHYIF